MRRKINKVQRIIFKLMELSSFNEFDGKKVVKDLIKNSGKWIGAIWGRFTYMTMLPLRDISKGYYNADTLYLSVPKKYVSFFEEKAIREWKASEVGYVLNGKTFGIVDVNLRSLSGDEKVKKIPFFHSPLGASPEPDVAYIRIWWD